MRIGAATSTTNDGGLAAAEAADAAAQSLSGVPCRLALVFLSAQAGDGLASAGAAVQARLAPEVMLGGVAQGVVGPDTEIEDGSAVTVWAAGWDRDIGQVEAFRSFAVRQGEGRAAVVGWPDTDEDDLTLLLGDPHSYPAGQVVAHLGHERPGHRIVGGMLTPGVEPGRLLLASDDDEPLVHEEGAVGVVLRDLDVAAIVSQGCRPVGEPLAVTKAEHHVVLELAGTPAVERLRQMFEEVPDADRRLMAGGLQVGVVADEYRDHFDTGDFLIRGVLGADEETGGIAIGEPVKVGQTIQFQVRDAASAHHDLHTSLKAAGPGAAGALLFTCNGRGAKFFDEDAHDARLVGELVSPQVAGAFCAGEIGPVGARSFLHGYTASLAVFRGQD